MPFNNTLVPKHTTIGFHRGGGFQNDPMLMTMQAINLPKTLRNKSNSPKKMNAATSVNTERYPQAPSHARMENITSSRSPQVSDEMRYNNERTAI